MAGNRWYTCPHCGKRLLKYEPGAGSWGVYIKCQGEGCGEQVEICITPDQTA